MRSDQWQHYQHLVLNNFQVAIAVTICLFFAFFLISLGKGTLVTLVSTLNSLNRHYDFKLLKAVIITSLTEIRPTCQYSLSPHYRASHHEGSHIHTHRLQ